MKTIYTDRYKTENLKAKNYAKPFTVILFSLFLISFTSPVFASEQNAFLIIFEDKVVTDSSAPLSQKSLERRKKYGIGTNLLDYHVNQNYIREVCADTTIHFMYSLKWVNGIVVRSRISNLNSLTDKHEFIELIDYLGKTKQEGQTETPDPHTIHSESDDDYEMDWIRNLDKVDNFDQLDQIAVNTLHQKNLTGKGVWIAVFDAGFYNIDKIKAFELNRRTDRLWSGYDVVDLDNTLTDTDNHGTAVTSCIAGYELNKYSGSAPEASIFLFRTENSSSEYPLEELNWMKAAEIADSIGVDMVSSSVGYTQFDDLSLSYKHKDLDGKTSYISHAARTLVQKGVLVITSAGNSGSASWVKIGTPGDVPEVVTVGAVDAKGNYGTFSSKGFNADGVVKPDVCALGVKAMVASTYNSYYKGNGTSYSTPIVSGAAACLLQAFPNASPSEIAESMRNTATHNSVPDSNYGYGVLNCEASYLYLDYSSQGFQIAPYLQTDDTAYLLFNNTYNKIRYTLYEERSFLGVFTLKKKIKSKEILSEKRFTYIYLLGEDIDCSKNYTLKLKLSNRVENHALKYRHLSLCERLILYCLL